MAHYKFIIEHTCYQKSHSTLQHGNTLALHTIRPIKNVEWIMYKQYFVAGRGITQEIRRLSTTSYFIFI